MVVNLKDYFSDQDDDDTSRQYIRCYERFYGNQLGVFLAESYLGGTSGI